MNTFETFTLLLSASALCIIFGLLFLYVAMPHKRK